MRNDLQRPHSAAMTVMECHCHWHVASAARVAACLSLMLDLERCRVPESLVPSGRSVPTAGELELILRTA